jgi:hypothetical protein
MLALRKYWLGMKRLAPHATGDQHQFRLPFQKCRLSVPALLAHMMSVRKIGWRHHRLILLALA